MQNITDEILAKAAEGDIAAFEAIYRATAKFVYNVAYRIVYNAQDAEEVTQEVFLKVHKELKNFRKESSIKTWIYRIASNSAINYSKKMAKEKSRNSEYRDDADQWQAAEAETARRGQHQREVVETLLRILNPDQRLCVVLRSIEGLSYREIAEVLKININTVRSRLKRAREKLLAMRREVVKDGV
ncbi:MAG: sigma-70 family RNA polymerase sigma factor [Candidatus Omnitrophica bacterium]|nr:sigma-70 family RNA polymerase sigma factor [Candidatus Omnitrophota bacterium]MDD5436663.1 sigma-70 family RNA polymerase sigma factor [Candidatus Omnitrophota bacterium]